MRDSYAFGIYRPGGAVGLVDGFEFVFSKGVAETVSMEAGEVRDILIDRYTRLVGAAPDGGGWTPDVATMAKLSEVVEDEYEGNLAGFLEHSMVGFLNRNGGGVGKPPDAKFFVNSYLTAESTLAYLRKHETEIHGVYCSLTRHEGFEGMLHAGVLAGEIQYLEGPLSFGPPDPASIRPDIYWMLASMMMGRFKKPDPIWMNGSCRCLALMNTVVPKTAAYQAEYRRFKASNKLRTILEDTATKAIVEATYSWLQQHRIASIFVDAFGVWQLHHADPEFKALLAQACAVTTPLADRDQKLRDLVGHHMEAQGKSIKPVAAFIEVPSEKPKDYPEVEIVEAWLSGGAYKKFVATEQE